MSKKYGRWDYRCSIIKLGQGMEWVFEEEALREDLKKMVWGASLTEHSRHRGDRRCKGPETEYSWCTRRTGLGERSWWADGREFPKALWAHVRTLTFTLREMPGHYGVWHRAVRRRTGLSLAAVSKTDQSLTRLNSLSLLKLCSHFC